MHRHPTRLLLLAFIFALLVRTAPAQSTSGSILGDIRDTSGAILPGATVRATNAGTGAVRETTTNEVGAYRFAGLPPANYVMHVEFSGFRTVERTVTLPVGGEIKVDFKLEVGNIAEKITVTEEAPLVQTTENTVQSVVDNRRVEELPLKSRDFMDLMLLAPGVTVDQSSAVGQNTDSVSFYGMDERNKTIWLEGVDFNDEVTMGGTGISEATRTRLGQEAIQEFQVMAGSFSAEFGRTGTGAINVVVKSGGNQLHGSGFYFLRDDSFDKPNFQVRGGVATPATNVPPFKIQQYGGTVGGPFKKDRAFYFVSLERRKAEDSVEVSIPSVVKNFVESLRRNYDTRSTIPRTGDEINALGKFTFHLHPSHTLNVAYLYDDREFTNKQVGGRGGGDNGFDDDRSSYYTTTSLTSLLGNKLVNEFRFNRSIQRLNRVVQKSANGRFIPQLQFPSVSLGTATNVPQGRIQWNWIVSDTASYQLRSHALKWGGEVNSVDSTADANITFNGSYRFIRDTDTVSDQYTAAFNLQFQRGETSDPTFIKMRRDLNMYALFANDMWRVKKNLTINMGIRYDLRQWVPVKGVPSIGGPDPFTQPGFSRSRPEEVWIAMALGPAGRLGVKDWRPAPVDKLDLSPRFGFSWDLKGTGKAVVRASYGIFHDRVDTSSLRGRVLEYEGLLSRSAQTQDAATIRANFPNTIPSASLRAGSGGTPDVATPTLHTPYTQQSTAGFQYALTTNMVFSVDLMHMLGLNFDGEREPNSPLPLEQTGGQRVCPYGAILAAAGANPCLRMQMHDYSDRIHINSLSFRLERRYSNNLGFLAAYTLASAKDFLFTSQWKRHGPENFGPTDNDVRSRVTGNVIYRLPLDIQISSIVTANSAAPYNNTTGTDDNLDFLLTDRPAGVKPFSLRGDPFFQMDLRLTKKFIFQETKSVEVMWEMFNVFNTANLVSYNGNQRATTFKQASGALPPFQAQLGLRFGF